MIVLAAFLDDVDDWEAMAAAAAQHGCRFVETDDVEDACRNMIYARLLNLRAAAPRGQVTFDSGASRRTGVPFFPNPPMDGRERERAGTRGTRRRAR